VQLVVLAAGMGSRFGGLKQLTPVGPRGEAIMDVLLERAASSGFDGGIVIVRSEIEQAVTAHFTELPPPLPWQIVVQPVPSDRDRPMGTAHAVLMCRDVIDGPFVVVNADDLYPPEAFAALARHLSTSSTHALVAFALQQTLVGDRPVSRALLELDGDVLAAIRENRSVDRASTAGDAWVSMNMWGFQPSIFDDLAAAVDAFVADGAHGEVLLPDVVSSMVAGGVRVRVLRCDAACIGITYAEDVTAVREALE
jgi:CTP:molybdopterin cytidylyltransferase MocA